MIKIHKGAVSLWRLRFSVPEINGQKKEDFVLQILKINKIYLLIL